MLHIFFKDEFIMQLKRDALYGVNDFICEYITLVTVFRCSNFLFSQHGRLDGLVHGLLRAQWHRVLLLVLGQMGHLAHQEETDDDEEEEPR